MRGAGRVTIAATLLLIVLGIIQLAGGLSLMAGNTDGRVIGIAGASLGAIGALLSIGRRLPVVVAGDLLPLRVRHPRHLHLRRRRAGRRWVIA
jgi:hypothetical protein